jgi:hypothetical protein
MLIAQERPAAERLRDEAAQLRAKAGELEAQGNVEEARELTVRADRLMEKAGRVRPEPRAEFDRQTWERKRDAAREQLEQLKREIRELDRADRHDEARRLERQARALAQRLEADRPPTESAFPRGPRPQAWEIERRMHHLRVAAESLHAIGMHGQAEMLMREAEAMNEKLHDQQPGREGEDLPAVLQELRARMEELHGAVRELHKRIDRLEQERR